MEREAFVSVLGAALFMSLTWMAALLSLAFARRERRVMSEPRAWLALAWPVVVGAASVTVLIGGALQEPDPADVWLRPLVFVLACLTTFVVLRALVRGVWTLRAPSCTPPAVTPGLWRPRVRFAQAFWRAASSEQRLAALAREQAHVCGRDPLRIWLMQRLADLQWPLGGAETRFDAWLLALEARRDDDAVAASGDPLALAEAIVLADV